jgi:hypothetical protein
LAGAAGAELAGLDELAEPPEHAEMLSAAVTASPAIVAVMTIGRWGRVGSERAMFSSVKGLVYVR